MLTFLGCLSMAYIAATLGLTGLYHLARHRTFRDVLRQHGLLPSPFIVPVAIVIAVAELLLSAGALVGMTARTSDPSSAYIASGVAVLLGLVFIVYILLLLSSPARNLACGCSPFAGETSRLSLIPGAGLALAAALGLTGMAAGGTASLRYATGEFGGLALLAAGYGVMLAILVMFAPEALRIEARRDATWMA